MIIRVANIDTTGTIYNKGLQILGYIVDNIVGAADDMGLQLNISKTKYMFSTKNKIQSQLTCSLTLGSRKFEVVKDTSYTHILGNAKKLPITT